VRGLRSRLDARQLEAREVQPLAELVRADGYVHQLAQPRNKDLHREAFTVMPSQ
jgi:hypothetical protein